MEVKNQTINGGKQQFADKIINDKSIAVGSNVQVGNGSFVSGEIQNGFNRSQAKPESGL